MKNAALALLILFFAPTGYASKLSHHIHKMEERERVREERERSQDADLMRQDMNFPDFSFRSDRKYINDRNERCRDYVFRSRSNPYRHGFYTVCDER